MAEILTIEVPSMAMTPRRAPLDRARAAESTAPVAAAILPSRSRDFRVWPALAHALAARPVAPPPPDEPECCLCS